MIFSLSVSSVYSLYALELTLSLVQLINPPVADLDMCYCCSVVCVN